MFGNIVNWTAQNVNDVLIFLVIGTFVFCALVGLIRTIIYLCRPREPEPKQLWLPLKYDFKVDWFHK